jgi:uncharacterized C2H2 Zn-finger protein
MLHCPLCGLAFKSLSPLKRHFSEHPEVASASTACPVCGRAFPTERSCEDHISKRRDDDHVVWRVLTSSRSAWLSKWKRARALQLLRSGYRLELNIVGSEP